MYGNKDLTTIGLMAELFGDNGCDLGAAFPRSDAEDGQKGARFIPFQVTELRRQRQLVQFIQPCRNGNCWFWLMPDSSRIYHYDSSADLSLRPEHQGVCPACGNTHFKGGAMTAEAAAQHPQKLPVTNTTSPQGLRDFGNRLAAGVSVEDMESLGTRELLAADVLPAKISDQDKATLQQAGVEFGDRLKNDPLFQYATLPKGWTKAQAADHRCIDILDEQGQKRAVIFYKAASYDRKAYLSCV